MSSASPVINSSSGSIVNDSVVTINGSGFGTKSSVSPTYWNNLESETIGAGLPGWSIANAPGGVVTAADKWSGNKSLYFAFKNDNWNQLLKDMGSASPKWFFHFKVRMNKNDTNSRFQWKAWRISSSSDGYAWNTEDSTAVMYNDWFWQTSGWFNTSTFTYFNNAGSPSYTQASFDYADSVLLNQWQTLEQYVQMSSAPLAADGITNVWRDGRLVIGKTNHVTHDAGSGQWRYVLIGQSINNELDANGLDANGVNDIDMYYDDLYIDNTQARVEICSGSAWTARGTCEIQIPQTTWNDTQIQIKINQGSFADNSSAYLYVVDENGNVNANGKSVFFVSDDLTVPAAPSGLIVQ